MPPTHGGIAKRRKRTTWVQKYGPFASLREAVEFRDQRKVVDRQNLVGLWCSVAGGNNRYRISACGAHVDCPVRMSITAPRADEMGYHISMNNEEHSKESALRVLHVDRSDGEQRSLSNEQKEYGKTLLSLQPSITPMAIWRAFQSRAEQHGASLRTGEGTGYVGAFPCIPDVFLCIPTYTNVFAFISMYTCTHVYLCILTCTSAHLCIPQ